MGERLDADAEARGGEDVVALAVITIAGVYHYLRSVLDGYSRAVVARDFADRMTAADVELILQRALEAHPGARPRVISDTIAARIEHYNHRLHSLDDRGLPERPSSR